MSFYPDLATCLDDFHNMGIIPPTRSNRKLNVEYGKVNVYRYDTPDDILKYDLTLINGTIKLGNYTYRLDNMYNMMIIADQNTFIIDGNFILQQEMKVMGNVILKSGSSITITDTGYLEYFGGAKNYFTIEANSRIIIEGKGEIRFDSGIVNVDVNMYNSIFNNDKIIISTATDTRITNIDLGDRPYSITEYELALRDKIINPHTQGEYNSTTGRVGYTWLSNNDKISYRCLRLSLLWGEMVLGDFKLSILGQDPSGIEGIQSIKEFNVAESALLYITNLYQDSRYLLPELYIGNAESLENTPGICNIYGNVVVCNSGKISLDNNGKLYIHENAVVTVKDNSCIQSTLNNTEAVLFIDGLLILDSVDQLQGFTKDRIQFGENGKIHIMNPNNGTHTILFSTPIGIHNSYLYELFEDRIDHICYHIPENSGIKIDKYYEYYNRDMTDWFGGRRIEKAIYDGILIWENGAFIELDNDIIPWANTSCSLLEASRLFKSSGSSDAEKLEEVAPKLKWVGSGDMIFRFVDSSGYKDVRLNMISANMTSAMANTMSNNYTIDTDNNGELFLKNQLSNASIDTIVTDDSKVIHCHDGENKFTL